jgi:hypothetical protein
MKKGDVNRMPANELGPGNKNVYDFPACSPS